MSVRQRGVLRVLPTAVNTGVYQHRFLIGAPAPLGVVRIEYANALASAVIPTNFGFSHTTPIQHRWVDSLNIVAHEAVTKGFTWTLLIHHDVVVPSDLYIKLRPHVERADTPIVSGLVYQQGASAWPLLYRDRKDGKPWTGWTAGKAIWCDAPVELLLVHLSVLTVLANESEDYEIRNNGGVARVRRVFPTQQASDGRLLNDPLGIPDLSFCDRVRRDDILKKAGWKTLAKQHAPWVMLCDTSLLAGHIDMATGMMTAAPPPVQQAAQPPARAKKVELVTG